MEIPQNRLHERSESGMRVAFRQDEQLIEATVENISRGGMCIRSAAVLPQNQSSFFTLEFIESGLTLNVEAEVVWSEPRSRIKRRQKRRPGMMGLRFVNSRFFTEETLAALF